MHKKAGFFLASFSAGFLLAFILFYFGMYNATCNTFSALDGGTVSRVDVCGFTFNYLSY